MKCKDFERYKSTFTLKRKELMVFLYQYSGAVWIAASLSEGYEGIFKAKNSGHYQILM